MPLKSYYKSSDGAFTLLLGDCRQLLSQFDFQFDMIFADRNHSIFRLDISC